MGVHLARRSFVCLGAAALVVGWPGQGLSSTPGLISWQIGGVKITRLLDLDLVRDPAISIYPFATPEMIAQTTGLQPDFIDPKGLLRFSYQGFLIETGSSRIIVDTGLGPKQPGGPADMGLLLQSLAAASVHDLGSVNFVVHTHLHPDHVGWDAITTGQSRAPTFPKARYIIARREYEFWSQEQSDAQGRAGFAAAVAPFWAAKQIELVASDHQIVPGVTLVPTPGHTPGHVSVRVRSRGQEALILGDVLHHPIQFARPSWDNPADNDKVLGTKTRLRIAGECADRKLLAIGSHFAAPTGGRVTRSGDGFLFSGRL